MTNYNHSSDSPASLINPKRSADLTTYNYDIAIMSVFEHQRLTAYDFAHRADFEWLLAQEFAVFTIRRQHGQWHLKVEHYIGVIILPSGLTLEILPKTVAGTVKSSSLSYNEITQTRQWVQLMLSDLSASSMDNNRKPPHSKSLGQLSQYLMPLSAQTPPLSQWLARQFLHLLSNYQPVKSYQSQTYNQANLQGKLLIKEQLLRNSHQPHKFACEVDHLSSETLANRVIKSALLLLEPLINTPQRHASPALSLSAAKVMLAPWRQITALSPYERQSLESLYLTAKRQLNLQPMSRQQGHAAHQLLDLAHWLLKMQQSAMPTGHGIDFQRSQLRLCVLINMNQAFEQWASLRIQGFFAQLNGHELNAELNNEQLDNKLDNHLKSNQSTVSYQTSYQSQQVWLRDKLGRAYLTIRPDLLVYKTKNSTRTCSHVIDIKWKHLSHPRDISASDAYQLTSYAQAYQAEQVWLIYPVIDDEQHPVALQQTTLCNHSKPATLWLMPFNVNTGTLNYLIS